MDFAIFNMEGLVFFFRWMHFFFGIVWIGLLYYFNFVQVPFFGETDGATKSAAIQKLVPRALWWFRWGAMFTLISGLCIYGIRGHQTHGEIFSTSWGVCINVGMTLAILMWANVWFVIWPNQKIVIQSTTQVADGGQALPEAAAAGAKALVASRTNTLFSIPMLFFMGAASHLPIQITETSNFMGLTVALAVILGLIELNVLKGGKLGPLKSVVGVIHVGLALAVALYVLVEVMM